MQNNPYANYYPNMQGGGVGINNQPGMLGMNHQPVQNRGNVGYANPNPGLMGQTNPSGGGGPYGHQNVQNVQNVGLNPQQAAQERDKQVQQLKSQYPNIQNKQVTHNNQSIELIELALQVQAPGVSLQVPLSLVLDGHFPNSEPKIYIRSKLKHNLFEVKDQIIQLNANNICQWNNPKITLVELINRTKAIFEKDPPKQEKIIEDVNKLLNVVTEQNFRDLVASDCLSQRSINDLQQLKGLSFQELICSSSEYKKIGNNLMDVINFNEKTANELLHKSESLEQHKQSLLLVADTIEQMTKEYNERVTKCRGFKDAFSRQNIEALVQKEIKNFDGESVSVESIAQNQHGNMFEVLQTYFDTRKNFHRLNIIKSKLPELKYQ